MFFSDVKGDLTDQPPTPRPEQPRGKGKKGDNPVVGYLKSRRANRW